MNITRRKAITSTLAAGATAVLSRESASARAASSNPPNIIFIMADDLGYADLSCYGRRDYETPEIDRLASQGIRLTQAYANSAVCSATRLALMTGQYQYRLPAGLEEPLVARPVGLPADHPTLPSLLRKAGYGTSLVGKWHLGALPDYGPLQSGYDHFWGFRGGGVDYFSHDAVGRPDLWDDDRQISTPGYLTDLLGQRAIEAIGRHHARREPFLLSLHFNAPHWPWEGPNDAEESRRLGLAGTLPAMMHLDGGSQKVYAEIVKRLDFQVGRVLAALEDLGIADNSIVIFTSDNGGERFSDVWPFSGRKTELLEGGLRIPAIIRWPAVLKAGVNDQVTITMDWVATLLKAARVEEDSAYPLDGIDIMPILERRAAPVDRTLFWRYFNLQQEACRQGNWKYLKILDNRFLFNVEDDPLERANLKDRHPDIFKRLTEAYRAWDRTMLPLDPHVTTGGFSGRDMADHFGVAQSHF